MQLVGYIVSCRDHEYVVVAPIKPTEQNKGWHGFNVYTSTDEIYSTAVKCHAKGVPAVFEVDKDGIEETLVATDIGPIDLTKKDVKERLEFLRNALDCADRNAHGLVEHVEEIVSGFLSALTHYRLFDEAYQNAYSGYSSAVYHADQLKEILDKESKQ